MDNFITCEFCGTVYDPAEGQCPTCQGKPQDTKNYKGDHYDYDERPVEEEPVKKRRGGKILALIALILLFLGFAFYIAYSFELIPFLKPTASAQSTALVPCTDLKADTSELNFTEAGQSATILTAVEPADTTDRVIFSVDNSAAVSVTQDGTVTAKAPGEANVAIICGKFRCDCKVVCNFGEQPAAEEEETAEEKESEPTAPAEPLDINETDISFFEKGESFTLELTGGDGSEPEWRSEDSAVATVSSKGEVVAVGSGTVDITATVGSETVTCVVRCQFE